MVPNFAFKLSVHYFSNEQFLFRNILKPPLKKKKNQKNPKEQKVRQIQQAAKFKKIGSVNPYTNRSYLTKTRIIIHIFYLIIILNLF